MPLTLHTPISDLYMVGEKYAEVMKKYLNIHTVEDLLYHFPFRYEDLTAQKSIAELQAGETVTLSGQILAIQNIRTRTGKQIQQGIFTDGQQTLKVTWFNQPFLTKTFSPGTRVNLAGKVEQFGRNWQMTSPKYEMIREPHVGAQQARLAESKWVARLQEPSQISNLSSHISSSLTPKPYTLNPGSPTHTGGIIPIYPETFGVSSKWLRSRIKPLIKQLDYLVQDWLPPEFIEKQHLASLSLALRLIHFPESWEDIKRAQQRLAFDEMFLLQLKTQHRIAQWHQTQLRHQLRLQEAQLEPFLAKLPFQLTSDQQQVLNEMIQDLNKPVPMNRLLEGDVGSGKTIVAAALMYLVWQNGVVIPNRQQAGSGNQANKTRSPMSTVSTRRLGDDIHSLKSILIAPTEVLAHQHLHSLSKVLEPHGLKIGFFTGSKKSAEDISSYDIYLGTHALLFQDLPYDQIALVIIDEQHRFGVEQRAKLLGKPKTPHVLSMTATPIPRTVALSLYGDLALSVITTKPAGRKPIKTWVVPSEKRKSGLAWIANQMKEEGTQAYFIYPLIDPSDKEKMANIKAAKAEYEALQKAFPDFKLGLLHGKLKPREKQVVMEAFAKHELDILVSTSVIEVGIDVPNTTIIVIEGAERFGLAALHQLRGRVGRSDKQSYCLLFTTTKDKEEARRLKAMETSQSGLVLAELDLKLRGPGELYGTQQSGFLELKIASLSDHELLSRTQHLAQEYYPKRGDFPLLQEKLRAITITEIKPN